VNGPVEALELTATVSADCAEPPLGGVTGFGLKPYVTPLGVDPTHEPDKVTAELKLLIDVTVIFEVFDAEPEAGLVNVSELGSAEMLKSGALTSSSVLAE
jgi:hypothetical protein